ncbi:nitrile hydratase subunit beta [Pelagibius sp. Alg239-R121]|uniref:nitrile hydratase subunit beta n=1 Tax=Pelagibius sp. Alg239-R121 TaxID=2993448 RepID=UPI0024A67E24|nr:nitrile hydratase subunit beta [Pelagibius sp. Alg239-R121]
MDGIHDVGGKLGFGPIGITSDEPPFHAPWEGRMFGIVRSMARPSDWNVDKFRHTRELEDPVLYLTRPYFDQWYKVYACMFVGSGVLTVAELASGESDGTSPEGLPEPMAADAVDGAKNGGASFERPYDAKPKFEVGDTARARLITPVGHCRLPAYVRGHLGKIADYRGAHLLADASAHNEERSEPLYSVAFKLSDLFPEREGSTDQVYLDLWESHLENDE